MSTEIILLLASTLLTSVLGIMLAIVAFNYRKIVSRYETIRIEEEKSVTKAMAVSREILAQAQAQASGLIERTESILGEIEKQFVGELEKMRNTSEQGFENMLANTQVETQKAIAEVLESAKKEVQKSTQELVQKLSDSFVSNQEELMLKMQNEIKQIYSQIDIVALEIAARLARDVLRRNLSAKDHEELIVESLERAKKDNLL